MAFSHQLEPDSSRSTSHRQCCHFAVRGSYNDLSGGNAQFTTRGNAFLPPFTLKTLKHASQKEIWKEEGLWKEKERKEKWHVEGTQAYGRRSYRCFSVSLRSLLVATNYFTLLLVSLVSLTYIFGNDICKTVLCRGGFIYPCINKLLSNKHLACCLKINYLSLKAFYRFPES